jgi:hypothetical protein
MREVVEISSPHRFVFQIPCNGGGVSAVDDCVEASRFRVASDRIAGWQAHETRCGFDGSTAGRAQLTVGREFTKLIVARCTASGREPGAAEAFTFPRPRRQRRVLRMRSPLLAPAPASRAVLPAHVLLHAQGSSETPGISLWAP